MNEKIILTIDDTPEILEILNSILGDDFDMRLAKTAASAWRILGLADISLILLDIEMPGMSGFEFLDIIHKEKTEYKDIPVVFISSNSDKETIDRAFAMGAAGYIVKPFLPNELISCVNKILEET